MNVKPGQVYRDDLNPNAFHRVVAVDERGIWTRPHRSPHASASLTNPGWFKVWHCRCKVIQGDRTMIWKCPKCERKR